MDFWKKLRLIATAILVSVMIVVMALIAPKKTETEATPEAASTPSEAASAPSSSENKQYLLN